MHSFPPRSLSCSHLVTEKAYGASSKRRRSVKPTPGLLCFPGRQRVCELKEDVCAVIPWLLSDGLQPPPRHSLGRVENTKLCRTGRGTSGYTKGLGTRPLPTPEQHPWLLCYCRSQPNYRSPGSQNHSTGFQYTDLIDLKQ